MKYFAKCNNVFNRNDVELINEEGSLIFTFEHSKHPIIFGLNIIDEINQISYRINYNPLKFKKRFQLLDTKKSPVMDISVGLKYLHKIEYKDKIYCCKGSIWKISYRLYDVDDVVASLSVVKINKQRYYKIDLNDQKNIMIAMAMLVVAQSIRERLFVI